jgi:hypothetical protein
MRSILSTALLVAAGFASLSTAAPLDLDRRDNCPSNPPTTPPTTPPTDNGSCAPIKPAAVINLYEYIPNEASPITKNFVIRSDSKASGGGNRIKTAMRFDIPQGKTGCRLAVKNPAGSPYYNAWGQIDTKISMVEDVQQGMSWNNAPVIKAVQEPGLPAVWNVAYGDTNLFAHQGACPDHMSFLFEYADYQTEEGFLSFQNALDSNSATDGFTIIYDNCT